MATMPPHRPQRRIDLAEIGRAGFRRFGGQIYEEFLTNLRGRRGIQVYREMRDNDPIIGATMFAIEQVIERAEWIIRPTDESALGKEAAQFLRSCMHDMEHTWQDFISEVLSMLTYGWAWFELVYKLRKGQTTRPETSSRENDGLVGWRKIARRHQASFYEWVYNEERGELIAMQQMAPPDYDIKTIPLWKSLHFVTKRASGNPEGRSVLRNAYRPWYFKKNLEEIEAIGVERDLVGLPVFTPPDGFDIDADENEAVRTMIQKMIANMRRDEQEGILLPKGFSVELLSIGGSRRQFDTDRIINRYDKRIAATALAQFIMLGMDRVGSFALSKEQNDLFLVAVQSFLSKIAAQINRVAIPRLFEMNPKFAALGSKLPQLVPGEIVDPNLNDLSNYVSRLADAGFILPKQHILDRLEDISGLSGRDVDRVGEIDAEEKDNKLVIAPLPPSRQQLPPAQKINGKDRSEDGGEGGGKRGKGGDDEHADV